MILLLEQGGKYTEEEKEKLAKKGWDTNAITPGKFSIIQVKVISLIA